MLAQAQLGAQQVAGGQLPAQLQAQIMVRATQLLGGRQIYPIAVVVMAVFVVGAGQGFFVELVFRFQAQATVVQIAMSLRGQLGQNQIRAQAQAGQINRSRLEAQAGGQLAPGQVVGVSWLARKVRPLDD